MRVVTVLALGIQFLRGNIASAFVSPSHVRLERSSRRFPEAKGPMSTKKLPPPPADLVGLHMMVESTTTTVVTTAAAWIFSHMLGGVLGTPFVMASTRTWYERIDLPSWKPPNAVFAPVWSVLYACMGVSAFRVSQRIAGSPLSSPALQLWGLHYLLNILWAPVFFGRQRLRLGLWMQLGMIGSLVFGVIPRFYSIDPLSGCLLVPYLGWLLFASVLNYSICRRNPTVKGYNAAMREAGIAKLQASAAKFAGV